MSGWFEIDRDGLAAVLERRGKFFAIAELMSNAWDSGSNRVQVTLRPVEGQPIAHLTVEDWGDGFADLREAFTMFGRSRRAADPEKRGRFSLGEKLVLAVCKTAVITTSSTSHALVFDNNGRKTVRMPQPRQAGTLFEAEVRMTRAELEDIADCIQSMIPPVPTTFNGTQLLMPTPIASVKANLPTEVADPEGRLVRSRRMANVEIYRSLDGRGGILEMGVPVCDADFAFRVNVLQKVPLNMERDGVTDGFRKALQVVVLNAVYHHLSPEEATEAWAQDAAGDARADQEAVKTVVQKRFGDRAVIATPGDPMANAAAEAAGFTVVHGGAMSAGAWDNVRKAAALLPASQVFRTPRPQELAQQNETQTACPTCGRAY